GSLRASGEYSDLIITCGSEHFKVHKAIVCTRSGFFACALRFPGKESQENKIDLPEDEPHIIELMLQYIYEGDYGPLCGHVQNPSPPSNASPKSFFPHTCDYVPAGKVYCDEGRLCPHHDCTFNCGRGSFSCRNFICRKCHPTRDTPGSFLIHSKMYEVGERYDVFQLKELARKRFEIACRLHWSEPHFFEAAYFVFTATPENDVGLRDIVCSTICDHLSLTNETAFEELKEDVEGLGYALFQHLMKRGQEGGWLSK
ncbi:uncharacterized protein EI97DRAFT_371456, partial [Westerdykella ornata]